MVKRYEEKDFKPLAFGKYKGECPVDIMDEEPGYLLWLRDNVDKNIISEKLAAECEEEDNWDVDPCLPDEW